MSKFITTKYGTRINVEGLTPQQIARVRETAEGKGAFGTKGAALAKELQKKNAKAGGSQQSGTDPASNPPISTTLQTEVPDLGLNDKTGVIDTGQAATTLTGAEAKDAVVNFNMNNPGSQTDILGNTQTITIDPSTGQVTKTQQGGALSNAAQGFLQGAIGQANEGAQLDLSNEIGQIQGAKLDLSGAPQILQTGDVRGDAAQVADANFQFLTRNIERDKRREMEDTKQMLAERGIPIDYENPDSMWNKALGSIDQKYQNLTDSANQQALMSRDNSMQALSNVQTNARNSFLQGAGMEFDATTGTAKDAAALKNMEAGQTINALGAANSTLGTVSPNFTPYGGGNRDISSILAQLLGIASGSIQGANALEVDEKTKMAQINKPTGGGGGGGGGFGITIGGVAP